MKLFIIGCLALTAVSGLEEGHEPIKCVPAKMIQGDCDKCVCTPTECTLVLCESSSRHAKKVLGRRDATVQVCEPGDIKWEDCNTCSCLHDGSGWACTMKACSPQICRPGAHYKKYCNRCHCSQDGLSEGCTRMACPNNVFNEDGSLVNPSKKGSKHAL